MKKATTARMSSQACSARKEKTWPAALKMKLTIEPMSPGRREPSFLPIAWSPCPTAFVPAFSPFIPARARALRTMPTARATACRVQPYFLKMFLTLSSRGLCLSLTSISVVEPCQLSASFAVTRACAASLSEEEVFSSAMMRLSSVILVSSSAILSVDLRPVGCDSVLFVPLSSFKAPLLVAPLVTT